MLVFPTEERYRALLDKGTDAQDMPGGSSVTNVDGAFEVGGLPSGRYTVRVSSSRADDTRSVDAETGQSLVMELHRKPLIFGRPEPRTDQQGRFTLRVDPSIDKVFIRAPPLMAVTGLRGLRTGSTKSHC